MRFKKGVYKIMNDLEIAPNEKLIIEAGAKLLFAADTGIHCEGAIIAEGANSDDELIVFSSLDESKFWKGIYICSKKRSRFAYCHFTRAHKRCGGGGAFHIQLTKVKFDNCLFVENAAEYGGAILFEASTIKFNNCYFAQNQAEEEGGAIYFEDVEAKDFRTTKGCLFKDNKAKRGENIYGSYRQLIQ